MLVQDTVISEKIIRLSKHYSANIATRFLRPAFAEVLADVNVSHGVSELTEHSEDFVGQGTMLEDLYSQLLSMAHFIFLVRRDVVPNLNRLSESNTKNTGADKVYRQMAFNTLPSNLDLLAKYTDELFAEALRFDKQNSPKGKNVYLQYPDLRRLKQLINLE